ncbi:MAG: methyl-accepting chemotaxis protein [Lachnospiraceae bacterium]|nr:methyl-accepting chemotaxis protein [Lachnospiraceae bacterium]
MKKLKSVKTRLILIMTGLVTIPALLLTIASLVISSNQGTDNAYEVNTAQAELVQEQIELIYAKNLASLKQFAASHLTVAYLEGNYTDADIEEKLLNQMLAIDADMADGNNTALSGADGEQRIRTTGKLVNVAEREYFTAPMSGAEYYISDLVVSKSTGTAIFTMSVPVIGTDGKPIGIVQRNYDCGALHDMLADDVTQDRQEIVVVDRTGTVVAHSAREINIEEPEMQDGNPFYTESRGDVLRGDYVSEFMGDTWIISWDKFEDSGWVVASCRVKEVALAGVYRTILIQIVLGIIFIGVGIFVGVLFANSITKPLKAVGASLSGLANGSFKKVVGYDARADEFGQIATHTNDVVDKLQGIVGEISQGAGDVHSSSESLATMSERISSNTESVSRAVQEIAQGATQQAEEIQHATQNIEKIEEAVANVQASTMELTDIAGRMQEVSAESASSLVELKESSETMDHAINGISEKISATSDAVGRINGMVEAISSIASQTNLLSLNASIEAARAGEAGRGFAVVAEEIGKLALDSNESAEMIRSEMDALLGESQAAVTMAENVQKTNVKQREVIETTFSSVNKMIEDIDITTKGVQKIALNAEACVEAKDVVVEAMSSLSAISEENAASSQETGASMAELSETVSGLSENAQSLRQVSEFLAADMEFFDQ